MALFVEGLRYYPPRKKTLDLKVPEGLLSWQDVFVSSTEKLFDLPIMEVSEMPTLDRGGLTSWYRALSEVKKQPLANPPHFVAVEALSASSSLARLPENPQPCCLEPLSMTADNGIKYLAVIFFYVLHA